MHQKERRLKKKKKQTKPKNLELHRLCLINNKKKRYAEEKYWVTKCNLNSGSTNTEQKHNHHHRIRPLVPLIPHPANSSSCLPGVRQQEKINLLKLL